MNKKTEKKKQLPSFNAALIPNGCRVSNTTLFFFAESPKLENTIEVFQSKQPKKSDNDGSKKKRRNIGERIHSRMKQKVQPK